ncbi:shikimate kinase, partial [Actinomadura luteofluorescens]
RILTKRLPVAINRSSRYVDKVNCISPRRGAAVAEALTGHEGVVSLGGGAVLAPETQELLAGHTVVYLRVGLSEAIKRVGLASARPLLVLNPRSQMRKLLEERLPIYERLGTVHVDTDGREPADIVEEVVKALEGDA